MKFPVSAENLNALASWIDLQDAKNGVDPSTPDHDGVQTDIRALSRKLLDLEMLPEVVCLVGSTRFHEEFTRQNQQLSLEGKIVLSIGCPGREGCPGHSEEEKRDLDTLHLRKIDLADRVLCLNVGGYIGESTSNELAYAHLKGKPIDYLEDPDTQEVLGQRLPRYMRDRLGLTMTEDGWAMSTGEEALDAV